ncbi:MAG: 50S ribosomal protein L5, partial [bacterium]|nr:50S ribosomal protein L5 [bacterium]
QKKIAADIAGDMSLIAGQKAVPTLAKTSIASFKSRQGMPIGVKVTLRGQRMYDFLDHLVNVVLPRSRDFRGIDQKMFDSRGNLTMGIREMIFFPEILPEKVRVPLSLEITISTTANSKPEGVELLRLLGFPIQ